MDTDDGIYCRNSQNLQSIPPCDIPTHIRIPKVTQRTPHRRSIAKEAAPQVPKPPVASSVLEKPSGLVRESQGQVPHRLLDYVPK